MKQEKKAYVFDDFILEKPNKDSNKEREAYQVHIEDLDLATCVMLENMVLDLQKQHEAMNAQDITLNFRELFSKENQTRNCFIVRCLKVA